MNRPNQTLGLRHVALTVKNLENSVKFYADLLGMDIEWQPDDDNVYLTSGQDNLALHRLTENSDFEKPQRLDHIGFIIATPEQVDEWYQFFNSQGVTLRSSVKQHRDGARSFYCEDPDGNIIQMIYHPPLCP